ncbi:MAG: hypothetical protein J6586_07150 [Snodgrassella sp.]|uniref:Uncharacterized protein n=2 Tax=Snodgrassella TaxID=1193515 RepID=A0A2N9XPZ8_9NEIS|nr:MULTISPECIES: hypothetical protein [Snodgrassella]MCO6516261.1 hypothetical protein [Snodgrassella sp.]PIT20659.1 hypothetical protein BGI35_07295 [Snodgrassella communis]PIT21576.1 hypothetical protein BGI36_05420 [Snodgrassella communis]PIT50403.1 hypothetical protein BHC48_06760 [Snodgrassella communis]
MEKEYTRATFVKRFLISLGSLIIGSPCFFIGIVGDEKTFPILHFLRILPMPENMDDKEIFYFTLGVMAFFATIILLIMMFGWMFDVSSNLFLKVLVVIGCCCGLPNALICLTIGSMLMGVGLLILPATLLACNLTVWYFESRPDDVIDQA